MDTYTCAYDLTPFIADSPDTTMPAAWSRATFTWRDTGKVTRCAGDYLDADPAPSLACGLEAAAIDLGFPERLIPDLYRYCNTINEQLLREPRAVVECPLGVLVIELDAELAVAEGIPM